MEAKIILHCLHSILGEKKTVCRGDGLIDLAGSHCCEAKHGDGKEENNQDGRIGPEQEKPTPFKTLFRSVSVLYKLPPQFFSPLFWRNLLGGRNIL